MSPNDLSPSAHGASNTPIIRGEFNLIAKIAMYLILDFHAQ
jgi:hypothetical protein